MHSNRHQLELWLEDGTSLTVKVSSRDRLGAVIKAARKKLRGDAGTPKLTLKRRGAEEAEWTLQLLLSSAEPPQNVGEQEVPVRLMEKHPGARLLLIRPGMPASSASTPTNAAVSSPSGGGGGGGGVFPPLQSSPLSAPNGASLRPGMDPIPLVVSPKSLHVSEFMTVADNHVEIVDVPLNSCLQWNPRYGGNDGRGAGEEGFLQQNAWLFHVPQLYRWDLEHDALDSVNAHDARQMARAQAVDATLRRKAAPPVNRGSKPRHYGK